MANHEGRLWLWIDRGVAFFSVTVDWVFDLATFPFWLGEAEGSGDGGADEVLPFTLLGVVVSGV